MAKISAQRAHALANLQRAQTTARDEFEAQAAEHATDLLLNNPQRSGPYAARNARRNARSIIASRQRTLRFGMIR